MRSPHPVHSPAYSALLPQSQLFPVPSAAGASSVHRNTKTTPTGTQNVHFGSVSSILLPEYAGSTPAFALFRQSFAFRRLIFCLADHSQHRQRKPGSLQLILLCKRCICTIQSIPVPLDITHTQDIGCGAISHCSSAFYLLFGVCFLFPENTICSKSDKLRFFDQPWKNFFIIRMLCTRMINQSVNRPGCKLHQLKSAAAFCRTVKRPISKTICFLFPQKSPIQAYYNRTLHPCDTIRSYLWSLGLLSTPEAHKTAAFPVQNFQATKRSIYR